MKMNDQQIRQAMDHRLSVLDADPSRRTRILQRIRNEEEPQMKKKRNLSLGLVLVLILALAGVALAFTNNLFGFFGQRDARYGKVSEQTALQTSVPVAVGEKQGETLHARFDSAYYDGITLNVAILIEKPSWVEAYAPKPDEMSSMEVLTALPDMEPDDSGPEETVARQALQSAMAAGTPYGYRSVEYSPSDHVLTDDGTEIPPYAGDPTVDENGNYAEMREFESPLPAELQNLNAITINCKITKTEQRWYFDGKTLYHQMAYGDVGTLHATVPKTDDRTKQLQGTYTHAGMEYTVTAQVSAMSALVTIHGDSNIKITDLLGKNAKAPEGIDPTDVWLTMTAYDEQGRAYLSEGGFGLDQTLPVTQTLLGVGELPQSLQLQVYLEWEGDTGSPAHPFTVTLK